MMQIPVTDSRKLQQKTTKWAKTDQGIATAGDNDRKMNICSNKGVTQRKFQSGYLTTAGKKGINNHSGNPSSP
jgi:hypothetical protein